MNVNEILDRLARGVRDMDEKMAVNSARDALSHGVDPLDAINQGLVKGMNEAGRLYEEEEYFVPELLLCSDAMYAGLGILSPHLAKAEESAKVRIVMGVVEGDTHDIGKNLVKLMLEVEGTEIFDLGRDVPPDRFVSVAKEVNAHVICLSTLMSTTMEGMETVIKLLEKAGIRDQVVVLVGGGPISQSFADSIGADGYSASATGAVKIARQLLGSKGVSF